MFPAFSGYRPPPFVAVYDKKGALVKVFDPPLHPVMEVPELVALVNGGFILKM